MGRPADDDPSGRPSGPGPTDAGPEDAGRTDAGAFPIPGDASASSPGSGDAGAASDPGNAGASTDPGGADVEQLRGANVDFYDAFERGDLDAMSALWEHSDRVTCVHPGWPALHGWGRVAASWLSMFQGPERLQFILTDERVEVEGDVGWVSVEENILGSGSGATVASVNVWVRRDGDWKIVAHHGAGVAPRPSS